MTTRKTVARKKGLDAARVVTAAIDLVEREGIDALTMRQLAAGLGVEAMSLYTYFESKHALEVAMCDHLLVGAADDFDRADPEATDPVAFARGIRASLISHPHTTRLFALHMNLQDSRAIQRLTLQSLAILASGEADATTVVYRFGVVLAFVVGHCLLEIAQAAEGLPPRSVYDPDHAFDAGVAALLAGVASPARR